MDDLHEHKRFRPVLPCPFCNASNNGFTWLEGGAMEWPPNEGDASICEQCFGVSVVSIEPWGIRLRVPTKSEMTWVAESFFVTTGVELTAAVLILKGVRP